MHERKKLLVELTEDDLKNMMLEILSNRTIRNQEETKPDPVDDLIPRVEVAKLFGISLVTLAKWARLKILPKPIKKGGRVFYLRSQINDCINPLNK